MGNKFGSWATLRCPRSADRQTDLFVGTEFIAPDVLVKTTNTGAPKKHRDYLSGAPVEGKRRVVPSNLTIK